MATQESSESLVDLLWSERDRELMDGACELHVHLAPCLFDRVASEVQFARLARAAGYRAAISKCHHTLNADRIEQVRAQVPGFDIFGGIVLNHFVGGLNPYAVEASIASGGKAVWMPTMHSANHAKTFGVPMYTRLSQKSDLHAAQLPAAREPISGLTEDGKLRPELYDILTLVAGSDTMLGTGHFSYPETRLLVKAARELGVKKIVVTHAEYEAVDLSIEQQVELAGMGALIEHVFIGCLPLSGRLDPARLVAAIRAVGPERTLLSTDLGQPYNPHPVEGMRLFIRMLLHKGVERKDIDVMLKKNPAELLGIEPRL